MGQSMFKNSEQNSAKLKLELEKIGLTFQNQTIEYRKDYWEFSCPWKNKDSIKIVWHKTFTEDTRLDLDDKVEFQVNNDILGAVDISQLLREKLANPLSEVIIKNLVEIGSSFTGKKSA
ncbi:MAG: hypothetical protein P8Q42_11850 [Flavobacteriales bacterium]|nr:hypothetical protein [Flavobacteriales bacterium]